MAEDERQIRMAIESMLTGSINSQRSSYTQYSLPRPPDITFSEDTITGARDNGKMSPVRRFFCLFVTFDLLLTILMWLICTMVAGESLKTAFIEQIVHYRITVSLVDIVLVAISRFTVLLLFYALVHLNHWIIVALSTAGTSAFVLTKVFLFDWTTWNQPVFLVLLILSSFVIAWAEAWFFDFHVIPQEKQATVARAARDSNRDFLNPERAPLLRNAMQVPHQSASEPSGTFFTPLDTPDHSDQEDDRMPSLSRRLSESSDVFVTELLPDPTEREIEEYKEKASVLIEKCHELLTSTDWETDYKAPNGDVVLYMNRPKFGGRIVRIVGEVDAPANLLVDRLFEDIETSPTWNQLVCESARLQHIDENTDIVYQATKPQAGGIIGARDFVILRHRNKCGTFYISSGTSVHLSSLPTRKHVTRGENGVSCWAAEELPGQKCRFTWILNTNLKGWLPQTIVQKSMSTALMDFMECLRKHVEANNSFS